MSTFEIDEDCGERANAAVARERAQVNLQLAAEQTEEEAGRGRSDATRGEPARPGGGGIDRIFRAARVAQPKAVPDRAGGRHCGAVRAPLV